MSNQFLKLRRSSVPGKVPTTSSLEFGEIALNTYDGLAFIKKSGSNGEEIIAIGATATVSGSQYFIPVFSGSGVTESLLYQSGSFLGFPNATQPVDPLNPDVFFISASGLDTYNLISAHSDRNGYVQLNIQNFSSNYLASSDVVATANNGNESAYYIDMGINSEGYSNSNLIGAANDAYVYSTGNDLYLGNASSGKRVIIFNGGFDTTTNAKIFIHEQGTVGINTSTYNTLNPPSLQVKAPNTTTYNVIQAVGETDNYSQIANVNKGGGQASSADIVVYNNIDPDNQLAGFLDMGINSTEYVYNGVYPGTAGDAYLFTDAHHLLLGSVSQSLNSKVTIFAGGISEADNAKLILYGSNQHQMTGSLNATEGFTGSLYGTASWALNALTASYISSGLIGNVFQIATGSVTASVNVGNDGIFLIKSASNAIFEISGSGKSTLYTDIFIVKNYTTKQPVLTVSESVVKFATHSLDPTGTTDAGSIWFTATNMYIALE
jgi:hypothetical protein